MSEDVIGMGKERLFRNAMRNGKGSATVEAVIAFTGFLLLIFTILNVVKYCRAQMLISNAMDTVAKELSQYSYFYEMSGLQKFSDDMKSSADMGADNINAVIGTVDDLYKGFAKAEKNTLEATTETMNALEKGDNVVDTVQNTLAGIKNDAQNIQRSMTAVSNAFDSMADDPILYMKSIVAVAGNEGVDMVKHLIAAPLTKLMFSKHFGSSQAEASEALEAMGVVDGLDGMNFSMSSLFVSQHPNDVHLVVYYRLKLVQLVDWVDGLEASICKEAVTRAWLGGDDVIAKVSPLPPPAVKTSDSEGNGGATVPADEGQEGEEQKEEQTIKDTVDTEGSFWYLPTKDEHYYDQKAGAFYEKFKEDYGIEPDTASQSFLGRDKNNRAMGFMICKDASEAEHVSYQAFCHSFEMLEFLEEDYRESGGEKGYEPGSTKEFTLIVYVPENISDEQLDEMKKVARKNEDLYYENSTAKTGLDLIVSIEYVRDGGNYDYGGDEG